MRDFRPNRRFGGNNRFAKKDFDKPREMHHATCVTCGNGCEVPFRPSGERPVYCNNCFQEQQGEGGFNRKSDSRGNFSTPRFENRQDSKPALVQPCKYDSSELVEQMKKLNDKMDRLLLSLEPKAPKIKTSKKEVMTPEEKV